MQDKESNKRRQEQNKITDKTKKWYRTAMKKVIESNQVSEKKKLQQFNLLLQQQEQYQNESKSQKLEHA